MKVVFFDLETTGTLVNKHGIHQISGMIVIAVSYTHLTLPTKLEV